MFKAIIAIMLIGLVGATGAFAAGPYLACDPVEGAVSYEVKQGNEIVTALGTQTEGGAVLLLDLGGGFKIGPHSFQARAVSAEGWQSEWTPPYNIFRPDRPNLSFIININLSQ